MSHAWIYMYWYLHVIFSCDVDIHIYITRIPFLLCIILNLFIWEPFRHFIISIMITNFYEHIFLLKWKLHTHFYDSRKQFNSILFFYFGGEGGPKKQYCCPCLFSWSQKFDQRSEYILYTGIYSQEYSQSMFFVI